MEDIVHWIGNNFIIAEGIAVVLIIGGVGWALGSRDGGKLGWIVLLAGLVLAVGTLKINGYW